MRGKEAETCAKTVRDLKIKTPNVEINAANLSGGNQQKVVVGKWLARNSRVVIFDEPTRGIDVAAKVEIYHLMNDLKKQGMFTVSCGRNRGSNRPKENKIWSDNRQGGGIVNACHRRPVFDFCYKIQRDF